MSLDQSGLTRAQAQPQTLLGLPVAVGQTIEVSRPFTDADWENLVADLRVTFNARGVIRQDGRFRQWTNGNLQALIEPTPSGFRLRLKTMNANARGLVITGLGGVAVAGVTSLALSMGGSIGNSGSIAGVGLLAMLGTAMTMLGAMQLPGWARRRKDQMEEISARVASASTLPSGEQPSLGRIPD